MDNNVKLVVKVIINNDKGSLLCVLFEKLYVVILSSTGMIRETSQKIRLSMRIEITLENCTQLGNLP